jgi:hypothetical protein
MQKLTQEDKDIVMDKTDQVLLWLEDDEESATKEEFVKRQRELASICNPIVRKMHKNKKSEEKKAEGTADDKNPAGSGEQPPENGNEKSGQDQSSANSPKKPQQPAADSGKQGGQPENMDTGESGGGNGKSAADGGAQGNFD